MSPAVAPVEKPDFKWPEGLRGALSLTFDDARASQVVSGVPLFNRFGVRATFYASIRPLEHRLDAWKAAIDAGHEVGAHTLTHPCSANFGFAAPGRSALEDMTLAQIEHELCASNARIETLLGVRPVSFAFPCGHKFVGRGVALSSYVPLVARHYLTGRGWRDEYFNAPDRCDLAQLGGVESDGMVFDQLLPQIERAAHSGNWLVLAGHEIGGSEERRQNTRIDALESICDYCLDPSNGIWLDTVGTIGAYVKAHRKWDKDEPTPLK